MPINPTFITVLATDAETRRGLFAATAQRMGTSERNVEKDFWVCLTLDVLFNGLEPGGPRLLFKGGTSLEGLRADRPLFRGHRRHRFS
jgi:predicted nucleotidyltransferase component of viral defense system